MNLNYDFLCSFIFINILYKYLKKRKNKVINNYLFMLWNLFIKFTQVKQSFLINFNFLIILISLYFLNLH